MDSAHTLKNVISPQGNLLMPPLAKMDPVGHLYLNNDLPLNIADAYTKMLVWDDPYSDLHKTCASKLVSLSHYKAFRDDALIPEHMCKGISMIGNLQVKAGDIVVSHPYVLFQRWLVAGLTRDPNLTERSSDYPTNCGEAYKCVWSDMESKALIDELCLGYINARRQTFSVPIDPTRSFLVTISLPTKDSASTWYGSVPEQAPFHDELVSVGKLYALTPDEWIHRKFDGSEVHVALGHIVCKLNFLTPSTILDDFKKAQDVYNTEDIREHLNYYFKMTKYEPKKHGSRAQFVTSTVDEADWEIHVSEEEANLGFMFNPCAKLVFTPHFKTYSRKRKNDSRIEHAKKDLQKLVSNTDDPGYQIV